ncbi:MAG: YafY family transcriptional regulator [Flavobacterium sp.]|uniref:helix-turn-helix transcriptional regulator n=1 Tax=Flavobacterium sp. TaxID=239 RepID=UPI00121A8A96|nr:YafY family protein [Flavobacterium sp.]RZJ68019.1 MAG: YafY family transcriptional regulator [Flavobacterium sp.]
MPDESPKRFDRIVSILIQLQSKKIVKAQELADRFDVSLRTIYRDIRTLEASGVPIYSEAGIGYSLVDGYRLPPVMFTREEASSFIAAEKLMQQFTDKELGENYASAMFKLKSVLRSAEKDLVEEIGSKVLVRNFNESKEHRAPNALASIFRSIGEKLQVKLLYEAISADEPNERLVEPVGVFHENTFWYIFGYCHLRKDYRQFRTDRIHDIRLTENKFELEHDALESYLKPSNFSTTLVRIVADKEVVPFMQFERKHFGFVSEKEVADGCEMTFQTRDLDNGFARWFLMFVDFATVLEPLSLNSRLVELMELGRARMRF